MGMNTVATKAKTGGMRMNMEIMAMMKRTGGKTTMAKTMVKKKTKMNTVATKATTGGMKMITVKMMAKKTGGKTNTVIMARMTRKKTMMKTTGGTEFVLKYT